MTSFQFSGSGGSLRVIRNENVRGRTAILLSELMQLNPGGRGKGNQARHQSDEVVCTEVSTVQSPGCA